MDSAMVAPEAGQVFLSDTVILAQELLSDILNDINRIQGFSSSQTVPWNGLLARLTLDISRFVEITTLLSKVGLRNSPEFLALIKSSHIHLLFVLKAMTQAQQKQDLIALEDLIKYELKDNLTQWKIDLIPKIKRLLQA